MVGFDVTLWPSKAQLTNSALTVLGTVVSMSANNVAHVQLPVCHAATKPEVVLKHSRSVEDALLSAKMDLTNSIILVFKKDDARQQGRRKSVQQCYAAMSAHFKGSDSCPWGKSAAIQAGYVDNLPLIKVTEMIGYDEISKPSPGARVEQFLS